MNKLASGLLIASLSLGGIGLASADSDDYRKGEHSGKYCNKEGKEKRHAGRFEQMTKELGLNESQQKQIKAIRDKYQEQRKALREKMRESRMQMRELMHSDKADEAAIDKAATAQADVMKQKIVMRSKMYTEINKVLTAEQREKMNSMRESHSMDRKEMKHREHE